MLHYVHQTCCKIRKLLILNDAFVVNFYLESGIMYLADARIERGCSLFPILCLLIHHALYKLLCLGLKPEVLF